MKIKFLPVVFLFIILVMVILLSNRKFTAKSASKVVVINGYEFKVEIADTDELRGKGLSGREKLPESQGMLFVYDNFFVPTFWMKEMKFPLDFIWINEDKIVDLSEKIPYPSETNNFQIMTIFPKSSVDKVLEVKAGTIKKLGIKVEDKIDYK